MSFVDHLRLANRADRTILRLLNLGGWFSTGAGSLGIARVPDPAGYSMCGSRRTQRLLPSIPRAAARKIDHSDDRPCPRQTHSALARAFILCVRGPYYECNVAGMQFSRGRHPFHPVGENASTITVACLTDVVGKVRHSVRRLPQKLRTPRKPRKLHPLALPQAGSGKSGRAQTRGHGAQNTRHHGGHKPAPPTPGARMQLRRAPAARAQLSEQVGPASAYLGGYDRLVSALLLNLIDIEKRADTTAGSSEWHTTS